MFTSPASNTNTVMSSSFRNQISDSYGNPLKMTWWMIGGNMFRYAVNTNVPIGNTMALYLMKKYYGDKIEQWGDELSLHYHTFSWTDYDNDGKYWWNQAQTFLETKDDFEKALRGHKEANDEMKSEQRDTARAFYHPHGSYQ